jgi:RimJ/RimL family protein N-acetyltransferase/glycosidase
MRATPLARTARHRHKLEPPLVATDGSFDAGNATAARRIAARLNVDRVATTEPLAAAGDVTALAALDAVLHRIVERERGAGRVDLDRAIDRAREALGEGAIAQVADAWEREFRDRETPYPPEGLAPSPDVVAELLILAALNDNPDAKAVRELVDDRPLREGSLYAQLVETAEHELGGRDVPAPGPATGTPRKRARRTSPGARAATRRGGRGATERAAGALDEDLPLPARLREPFVRAPGSLAAQLRWVRDHWAELIAGDPALGERISLALDVLAEEARALELRGPVDPATFGGPTVAEPPDYHGLDPETEAFSADTEWMPSVVLQAKSSHVWLEQLARRYGRPVVTLADVPDAELDRLASLGITGLWLIGLWQRSRASAEIKRRRGDTDAVASAYSIDDYRIADDLGGEAAFHDLRDRAFARGIRLAADMVPNHMGLDSSWVIEHPDRFIAVSEPPFPAYTFEGPDLSPDPRVEIRLEDHYWDGTDAAVVFRRRDTGSGETRFIYHGNDGTSFPWNDTAQLDYLQAAVREAVIQTILAVARRAPILRFDAAMVLARRHIRRLWYPEPGAGGAIPSRAEHALSTAAFDRAMPREFWREVVDRVAAEAPGTLLLAEAFWLLEGYFVRTLGMHRVYNSAFMHMLRDEDNAGYRKVLRDTLEFDPGVLGRFVNFLTNPDERPAAEQFGTGDKAFAAMTLLATLPGLPMIGHGQVEGYRERYGMEFRRARWDEPIDEPHMAHFERTIVPLLKRRASFARTDRFRLYDAIGQDGSIIEDVLAFSNGSAAERSLVLVHNRAGEAEIRIERSAAWRSSTGARRLKHSTLAVGLELPDDPEARIRLHDDRTGRDETRTVGELRDGGLALRLMPYEAIVFGVEILGPHVEAAPIARIEPMTEPTSRWVEPVVLEGRIVRLEPLSMAHLDDLAEVAMDPEIWQWTLARPTDKAMLGEWIQAALANAATGAEMPFATLDAATGKAIGSSRFMSIVPEHRRLEIGWTWLGKARQLSGANREAKLLQMTHAFEGLGANRVEFKTDSLNEPARRALLGIGSTFEGIFRNHMIMPGGRLRHSAYYSVVAEEWPAVKARLEAAIRPPS